MRRQGFQEGFIRGGLLEVSWRDFWARSQKYLKWPPGGLLPRLLSLEPEMLQNDLLEVSWKDFWARSQKAWFLEPYQSVVRIYVYMHGFWNPISQLFAYTCICMVFGTLSISCLHIRVYMHGLWNPMSSVVRICVDTHAC